MTDKELIQAKKMYLSHQNNKGKVYRIDYNNVVISTARIRTLINMLKYYDKVSTKCEADRYRSKTISYIELFDKILKMKLS